MEFSPKFVKKQLCMSTTRNLHFLKYPHHNSDEHKGSVILWNPSTREFKELPPFEKPVTSRTTMTFGFGYDSSKDNYKEHPFGGLPILKGDFVSGTINWMFSKEISWYCPRFIVSFDLAKESYQKISPPNLGGVDVSDLSALGVLRDCLCVTTSSGDVWVMKEYGNKESWIKVFNIPYTRDPSKPPVFAKPINIFEDDLMLLKFLGEDQCDLTLILYDCTSDAWKDTDFIQIPEVCVESLISPYSLCRM